METEPTGELDELPPPFYNSLEPYLIRRLQMNRIKWRIAIWLGEISLALLCWQAMTLGYTEVATGAVVGLVALLPKLVESEEKGG